MIQLYRALQKHFRKFSAIFISRSRDVVREGILSFDKIFAMLPVSSIFCKPNAPSGLEAQSNFETIPSTPVAAQAFVCEAETV